MIEQQVAPAAEEARTEVAVELIPLLLDAQQIVQEALPAPPAAAPVVTAATAALIVRWEVTSEATYTRKYRGVICPGGASGPTIGIGYDLGHQTRATIARDWAFHPAVAKLQTGSGMVGEVSCKAYRDNHRDVRIEYRDAVRVFAGSTLPVYHAAARRALKDGWERLPADAQGGNVSLGYNRGWSMVGARNREKRAIRDDCVPAADLPCNATQLRAMCRIWAGTPNGKGLCARRHDEARLVEHAR